MPASFTAITSPAALSELVRRLTELGSDHHTPLIRAAMVDQLRVAFVPPRVRLPLELLHAPDLPPLVTVIEDDGERPAGPGAFPQAGYLLRWAEAVILHAAGGKQAHYDQAVLASTLFRRVLVIDTATAKQDAWMAPIRRYVIGKPFLWIKVPDAARPHPCDMQAA